MYLETIITMPVAIHFTGRGRGMGWGIERK
jgi:hypothetical protein